MELVIATGTAQPLDFLKNGDSRFPGGEDANMKMGNLFKKRPEKKAAPAPAPSTYRPPVVDPQVYTSSVYTEPSGSGHCVPSSSHHSGTSHPSHDSGSSYGGHSSHSSYSHDSGSSHSFGSHDSGSSGCDGGGGF